MKNLLFIAAALFCMTAFYGCSKCKNEDPRARIVNNGTDKVSVQIMTSGGNTENINNILPDQVSPFTEYAPGVVTYTIAFQNNTDTSFTVALEECWEYDIVVDENDNISSVPTDRNE